MIYIYILMTTILYVGEVHLKQKKAAKTLMQQTWDPRTIKMR